MEKSINTIINVYNNKELTYSQYKTKFGLLICYYINKYAKDMKFQILTLVFFY